MKVKNLEILKPVAADIMRRLDMFTAHINAYEMRDVTHVFDDHIGVEIMPGTELSDKIKQIEHERNVKIYAVTHDYLVGFGEMYSFLCVSPYAEDWDSLLRYAGKNIFMAYAYVWNVQDDLRSEFGYVAVSTFGGGLRREG